MGDTNWSQVIMPLFLLAIMILSVVGLSYTPNQNQGAAPTGQAQSSFTYEGYDFEYVQQGGRQVLQASIDGRTVQFRSRPQSITRFQYPSSFQSMVMNTSSLTIIAPQGPGDRNGQARYAAEQLASDINRRTAITATSETTANPSCDGGPRILVQPNQTDSLLTESTPTCHVTSTLDQSILLITDIIAYTYYDII
jgi:hypothetical protein